MILTRRKCFSCSEFQHGYTRGESFLVCHYCMQLAAEYLQIQELADHNPFAAMIGLSLNPNLHRRGLEWAVSATHDSASSSATLPLTGRWAYGNFHPSRVVSATAESDE